MSAADKSGAALTLDHGRIPVLDIGPYLAGEPGAATALARALACTFADTGFLVRFIRIFGAGWAPSELVRVRGSVITPREERGYEEDRIWHVRTSAVSASSAG